jgi:hypothetical protein
MNGPFETEREAAAAPAVPAVCAAYGADPGAGKMAAHNLAMLRQACEAAGLELGAFDRRVLAWLAGFERATCAVVAGIITRAAAGGRAAVLNESQARDVETARAFLAAAGEGREALAAHLGTEPDPALSFFAIDAYGALLEQSRRLLLACDELTGGTR